MTAEQGFASIRPVVHEPNETAVSMYRRSGYTPIGAITHPLRKAPYLCCEKILEAGG
ncbi:hypothetical protein G5B47_21600 [Paenibacillus sp. 7124]|uniref:N-acetyltransferase domain-containing protein n=1 Tax=Paenibacillus apii TaxID=1850370 RepID=A0A6M1PP21_9BACL|nr:hypothetical protein [Paenibacillus apii]NGM85000.1 hypothetical protein [Paenibacillus apii]NJJ38593.1 hypothetical protein [Paenibacillus apii]